MYKTRRYCSSQPKRLPWLKWLRRIHAWVGLWGAALGLLFGVSGILLNHRAVMKIPAAQMEQSQVELALPDAASSRCQSLASWLQAQLNIDREPSKISTEPAKTVTWAGQSLPSTQPMAGGFSQSATFC